MRLLLKDGDAGEIPALHLFHPPPCDLKCRAWLVKYVVFLCSVSTNIC